MIDEHRKGRIRKRMWRQRLMSCDCSCFCANQVDKLDKNAISEVKAYNKPPKAVETVLSAAMTLFGQPTDWANSKKVGRHRNGFREKRKPTG